MKKAMINYIQSEKFDDLYTPSKDEFIKKCYEWNKPFCLLLPITALEGKARGKLFKQNGIEVLVFDGRVEFLSNKKGNWFNTSWFCHNVLPEKLIFEELRKEL